MGKVERNAACPCGTERSNTKAAACRSTKQVLALNARQGTRHWLQIPTAVVQVLT